MTAESLQLSEVKPKFKMNLQLEWTKYAYLWSIACLTPYICVILSLADIGIPIMLCPNEDVLAKFITLVISELPTVGGILHIQLIFVADNLADK